MKPAISTDEVVPMTLSGCGADKGGLHMTRYRDVPPTIKISGHDVTIYHGACIDCSSQWEHGNARCEGCYFYPHCNYPKAKNLQIATRHYSVPITDPLEIIDKLPAWEWIAKDPNILDVPDRRDIWQLIHKYRAILRTHGIEI